MTAVSGVPLKSAPAAREEAVSTTRSSLRRAPWRLRQDAAFIPAARRASSRMSRRPSPGAERMIFPLNALMKSESFLKFRPSPEMSGSGAAEALTELPSSEGRAVS